MYQPESQSITFSTLIHDIFYKYPVQKGHRLIIPKQHKPTIVKQHQKTSSSFTN
ncbi:hypothetical protein GI584_23435 [Gracilibacillus salitolerans]|uniref:Uncharacterized protein n=1 Tax=Gracilibacillus salitolerans TaxID=2663022 RepID=A0A5Q2TRT0_9BACI|nr:hypothetical protein [Gracilibacillus salitolerans]QGH36822.1 hypothetical protein GI584_23435 [Gracilibacillus salitolerans]